LKYKRDFNDSNTPPLGFDSSAEAIITLSSSRIMKLVPGEEFFGELKSGSLSFALFKIDPPTGLNT
jgi:hypothetical protein